MLDEYGQIRSRPFLHQVYMAFYRRMAQALGHVQAGNVLELGSGGGCIKEVMPSAITSDIRKTVAIDLVCSAYAIPIPDSRLDAIVMLNVFHHLENPDAFLREVCRCLRPGGRIAMIDPTDGWFARLIWTLHHEVFYIGQDYHKFQPNQALAWIVFVREAARLKDRCPDLVIRSVERFSCLAYIASGGLSHRMPIPALMYPVFEWIDRCLGRHMALMQIVILQRLG